MAVGIRRRFAGTRKFRNLPCTNWVGAVVLLSAITVDIAVPPLSPACWHMATGLPRATAVLGSERTATDSEGGDDRCDQPADGQRDRQTDERLMVRFQVVIAMLHLRLTALPLGCSPVRRPQSPPRARTSASCRSIALFDDFSEQHGSAAFYDDVNGIPSNRLHA